MKSVLIAILLLVVMPVWSATLIRGKLGSYPEMAFTVKLDESPLNDYAGVLAASGKTDTVGRFEASLEVQRESVIKLFIGNVFFVLWIRPNSTLTIESGNGHAYHFTGETAAANSILLRSGLMFPFSVPGNTGLDVFDAVKNTHYLDSIELSRHTLLDAIALERVSDTFREWYDTEIRSFTLVNKSQYVEMFRIMNKLSAAGVQSDYFDFWKLFRLASDSINSNRYLDAIRNLVEYRISKRTDLGAQGSEQSWNFMFRETELLLKDRPLTLMKQQAAYLLLLIKYFDLRDFTSREIAKYHLTYPNSVSGVLIEKLWDKKTALTQASPAFQLNNQDGKPVDIRDFIGKVVYVDFWGSWCKACLLNVPRAEKLKDRFAGKGVVFLYIDFYDTKEKWMNAIKKYNIVGIHVKAEKEHEDYFNKQFGIANGFPRYALIDKQGRLITISAPQPQEEAAAELIEKFLGKD